MARLAHEQWLRTEALFLRLLDLPAAECAATLRRARTEDAAVVDEAGAMLAGLDVGDDFLRQPVQISSTEAAPEGVPAGTRYGPWRALGLLNKFPMSLEGSQMQQA